MQLWQLARELCIIGAAAYIFALAWLARVNVTKLSFDTLSFFDTGGQYIQILGSLYMMLLPRRRRRRLDYIHSEALFYSRGVSLIFAL